MLKIFLVAIVVVVIVGSVLGDEEVEVPSIVPESAEGSSLTVAEEAAVLPPEMQECFDKLKEPFLTELRKCLPLRKTVLVEENFDEESESELNQEYYECVNIAMERVEEAMGKSYYEKCGQTFQELNEPQHRLGLQILSDMYKEAELEF